MDEHDELLITKWLMLGGVLWDSATSEGGAYHREHRFFAIEPNNNEFSDCKNANAATPADAVRKYIWTFRIFPCLLDTEHEKSLMLSRHGRTEPVTGWSQSEK